MAPGTWAEFARALRKERKALERTAEKASEMSDGQPVAAGAAFLVLQALEDAAQTMAGGRVYD